jgi:poly(A) polymerase
VRLAERHGLLRQIIPELAPLAEATEGSEWTHTLNVMDALTSDRFETALALLLGSLSVTSTGKRNDPADGTVGAVSRRLRLSNHEREAIEWLVSHRRSLDGAEHFTPARLKRLLAHPLAGELLHMARAEAAEQGGPPTSLQFTQRYLETATPEELNPTPLVTGDDLVRLGGRPGPEFKRWLDLVRDAQLNGELTTTAEAVARLTALLAQAQAGGQDC